MSASRINRCVIPVTVFAVASARASTSARINAFWRVAPTTFSKGERSMKRLRVSLCFFAVVLLMGLMPAVSNNRRSAQPFQAVVLAGHSTLGGEYCTCGCANCICDPGETPNCRSLNDATLVDQEKASRDRSSGKPESSGDGGVLLFGS